MAFVSHDPRIDAVVYAIKDLQSLFADIETVLDDLKEHMPDAMDFTGLDAVVARMRAFVAPSEEG